MQAHHARDPALRQEANYFVGVELVAGQILPDYVQTYRGVYARFREEPGVPAPGGLLVTGPPGLTELVGTQQNFVAAVGTYIAALGQTWQGVVDVADLLQTPDLFGLQGGCCQVGEIPDLEKLNLPAPKADSGLTTLPAPRAVKP